MGGLEVDAEERLTDFLRIDPSDRNENAGGQDGSCYREVNRNGKHVALFTFRTQAWITPARKRDSESTWTRSSIQTPGIRGGCC